MVIALAPHVDGWLRAVLGRAALASSYTPAAALLAPPALALLTGRDTSGWRGTATSGAPPAGIPRCYTIARPGFRVKDVTLVTSLLDAERYTAEQLAEAYGMRWTIETCYAHLKTTMKMDVLRCQTVRGVLKELTMFLLVYNIVRMTMLEAARRQEVSVDRISFVDALRWLATAKPGDELRPLVLNRRRPNRAEQRVRKRRPKQYPLMKIPRDELRKALLQLGVAA